MLLDAGSNAFGCWELCSWRLKAMLLASEVQGSGAAGKVLRRASGGGSDH